jgi:hypothetical protein
LSEIEAGIASLQANLNVPSLVAALRKRLTVLRYGYQKKKTGKITDEVDKEEEEQEE